MTQENKVISINYLENKNKTGDKLAKSEYDTASLWQKRILNAIKIYQPYYEEIKKARIFYKTGMAQANDCLLLDEMKNIGGNLFWSGIETQKPFLYFKTPKPYLERLNKHITPAERLASKILERALEWDLTQFDFDSVIKYARNDYLISGCGILWESYLPHLDTVELSSNETIQMKTAEYVVSKYIDPLDFLIDPDHTGIFEEADWIARRIYLSDKDVLSFFGKDVYLMHQNGTYDRDDKTLEVYEIWDKETKKVYWYSLSYPSTFLKVMSDPLNLNGFFPIPKPIFATMTNDSLIPVSDFQMIEKMLEELKGVATRMRLIMQAIKVSGVYDASFSRMSDIFDKDVSLLALNDFERLKESGGIKGVIDFIPINQYITALEVLSKRRDALKEEIFAITGISDIMRGNSTKIETATAVEKKTNFGTLRNQDRQNDMQRFIMDCYKIKAEIICEQFSRDFLSSFVAKDEGFSEAEIDEAIHILKSQKLRDMALHIETDAFFNQADKSKKMLETIDCLSKLLLNGVAVVSNEPLLLPIYKEMILSLSNVLPQARCFEQVVDKTFVSIQESIKQNKEKETLNTISLMSKSPQNETDKLKYMLDKQSLLFKLKELMFKEKELIYKEKKANLDFQKELIKEKPNSFEIMKKPKMIATFLNKMKNILKKKGVH